MFSPEDSLVAPPKRSLAKPALVLTAIVALGFGGYWMFGRGKGQPESVSRVLIISPTPGLVDRVERWGFDADHLSLGAAIGEGQVFDPELDDLAAIVEYADQAGYGFVALDMLDVADGHRYEFAEADYEATEPPSGTTFAVISVGDLGRNLSFGAVPAQVAHVHPRDAEIGLLLALFGQPEIAKAKTRDADNDLMIRFGSAGTVEDVIEIEKAHESMRRQAAAWDQLAEKERHATQPIELARPYEQLRGWPLANGAVLLAAPRGAWRSNDGLETQWDATDASLEFSVIRPEQPRARVPCPALPDTLRDGGFVVGAAGDSMLIPSSSYIANLWALTDDGCGFEQRDEIRRLDDGELGQPHASGRTADSQASRLTWADAKQRSYIRGGIAGVEVRTHELRWITDEIVAIPASLQFGTAATDLDRRRAEAALAAVELAPLAHDPGTLPTDRAAIVLVRLPHGKTEALELAVIPVDALAEGDPSTLTLRMAAPITPAGANEPTIAIEIDGPSGHRLVRVSLASNSPAWRNGKALDYDLAAAAEAGKKEAAITPLGPELPAETFGLAISPTGSHAAWAQAVGEDQPEQANLEIFVLELGAEPSSPVQLTDNDRRDLDPWFAGKAGELVVFSTSYVADEKLPEIVTLRALPLP